MPPLRMPLIPGMLKWRRVSLFHAILQVSCVFLWAVTKVNDTPEGDSNEASLPNGVAEEILMPPNLETFIPGECHPDIIDVYSDDDFFHMNYDPYSSLWKQFKGFTMRQPIKFVRQYPQRTLADEGTFNAPS
jgi:hypothetical protein